VDKFNTLKESGEVKPFGSSLPDRFSYLGSKKKNPNLKHTYVSHDFRINNDSTMSSKSHKKYSFGVGRAAMQPMFIDELNRRNEKKLLPPGPGTYIPPKSFGNIGQQKSFASRLSYDTI